MPPISKIAAFIFDLDGLVLDTEPSYQEAWQTAIELMDLKIDKKLIQGLSGLSYKDVLTTLQGWCGDAFNAEKFSQVSAQVWHDLIEVNGIKVNKGVIELLEFADRNVIPFALATNSAAIYAQKCLNIAGLGDKFPIKICADDVFELKPAPEIFLLAADRLNVNIKDCIVFEDSCPGILAASSAGAYSVYVPSVLPVNPMALDLCDLMLTDLMQVFPSLCQDFSGKI